MVGRDRNLDVPRLSEVTSRQPVLPSTAVSGIAFSVVESRRPAPNRRIPNTVAQTRMSLLANFSPAGGSYHEVSNT
jgi:hypothetical protein